MDYQQLESLVNAIKDSKKTIMFAESMTAGMVSSEMASIPGVSSILLGSIVCYSPKIKRSVLKVSKGLIKTYSAESLEVTGAMAEGLIDQFKTDIAVAITGAASNSVNDYQVTVKTGTIFVCIIFNGKKNHYQKNIEGDRNEVRQKATNFIFEKLQELIENYNGSLEESEDEIMFNDIIHGLKSSGQLERSEKLKKYLEKHFSSK